MFKLAPPSTGARNNVGKSSKHGFSLVELIVALLIIAILAVAVFAGGSAAIRKANKAKTLSDLRNFQIAVTLTMGEHPEIANIDASTKKEKLSVIMDALNDNLPKGYKVTLQTDAMDGNISMDAQTDDNADFIICKSEKTDAWDNPYFVIIDSAQRGGSALSEFYMTTVSAGPNAILNLTSEIDVDDVFDLSSYADGDVKSEIYDISEAAPTIEAATNVAISFTDPMEAPVNNGVVGTPDAFAERINEFKLSAPITNLSGTTWEWNDNMSFDGFGLIDLTEYELQIDTNGEEFDGLFFTIYDMPRHCGVGITRNSTIYQFWKNISGWVLPEYKQFTITGGASVTNEALISAIQANATRIG